MVRDGRLHELPTKLWILGPYYRMDIGFYTGGLIMAPTTLFTQDPCPLGLPEMLTLAHMTVRGTRVPAGFLFLSWGGLQAIFHKQT